jgi:tRNA (guanine6-N2)-methyltransferase
MAKSRNAAADPPCYALLIPGLEPVAYDEITRDLGGEVKRTAPGLHVFRPARLDTSVLSLRTVEDVFLFAWGTDQLTHRAEDLDRIERWTSHDADWERLLRVHHGIRPKPKGRPTYHLVTQLNGKHAYRRVDARQALARGLAGKFPASWRYVEDNASIEVWLTIEGNQAVCGLRLSDRSMRHRDYKLEHLPASLRPTLAAAMVRLGQVKAGHRVLDPMCGAGTLLAECLAWAQHADVRPLKVLGGDIEPNAVRCSEINLRRHGNPPLMRWDARRLPLGDLEVDRILSNPPFGKQLSRPEEIGPLYRAMLREYDRVLKPHGLAVLLVSDFPLLKEAASEVGWHAQRQLRVRVLGQPTVLTVWRKGAGSISISDEAPDRGG